MELGGIMKAMYILLAIFMLSCNGEDCVEQVYVQNSDWVEYTLYPGEFAADPSIVEFDNVASGRWEFKFSTGMDECHLEPFSECHDLMKAGGHVFGHLAGSNSNNVMCSWRFLPDDELDRYTGKLEVTPYMNINGEMNNRWFTMGEYDLKEWWPIIEVELDKTVAFQYTHAVEDSLDIQLEYEGAEYKMRVWHPNIKNKTRTIGVWGGGTTPPVIQKTLYRRRICM